jgi:hypothetical protein
MLHTMKRQYVDNDEKRKTAKVLSDDAGSLTKEVETAVTKATALIIDRQKAHMLKHGEMVAATHDHLVEASRLYRKAVDKQVESLHKASQSSVVLAQDLKVAANKVKEKVLSVHVVPSLKLDDKELCFVKQLKELQEKHRGLQIQHTLLEDSKKRLKDKLAVMQSGNDEAAGLIFSLEGRIKGLDQEKLGLERQQVKLEKEVESLKRKRRDSPSPSPLQPAPKLRILRKGESISPTPMESSFPPSSLPPPKKSRNRQKRWDQPAPKQGGKVPSPADNLNEEKRIARAVKVIQYAWHKPSKRIEYRTRSLQVSGTKQRHIDDEIRTSSKTVGYGSNGSAHVLHRGIIVYQCKVIAKANAYVEVIIMDSCKFKVQGDRGTAAGSPRNYVQAY